MLTKWEYSVDTEAYRLIHVAHNIANGFFKTNNFIVLPYNPNTQNANIVTFPDLPYNSIPRFWNTVKIIEINDLPVVVDPKMANAVKTLVVEANLKVPHYQQTKDLWEKAEADVINEIYKVLPDKKDKIRLITINPTLFGTSASFNFITDLGEIVINLREDQGIHTIVEAIITSLTRKDIYEKLDGLWSESEIITDYLVTQSSIATVLQKFESVKKYLPTITGVRSKELVKLMQESEIFYNKLGIPIAGKQFKLADFKNLTETEEKLLEILIKNVNKIVDMDAIGEAIFGNEDDFSLYSISKTVQRLRDKFEANGISGSYIQTLRGKGYLLKFACHY